MPRARCLSIRPLALVPLITVLLITVAGPAVGQSLERVLAGRGLSLPAGSPLAGSGRQVALQVGADLATLLVEYRSQAAAAGASFAPSNPLARLRGDSVLIDATAVNDARGLGEELRALGLENLAVFGRRVSGFLPISAIERLPMVSELRFARPSYSLTGAGSTATQGDHAMGSDAARSDFPIDGSGATVGTLSSTYDSLGGAATDLATGDLPPGVTILDDSMPSGNDEGRAMMQLVHDVAPGAGLSFHTAIGGQADFALGIQELAGCPPGSEFGCTAPPGVAADVICDDVLYLAEPMFQDGIIGQAIDFVVDAGVAYFTFAGNQGRDSYESSFRGSGVMGTSGERHDFDPGAGVDTLQGITVPVGSGLSVAFQWDQPFYSVSGSPGSASDLDFYLLDAAGGPAPLAVGADPNVGGDPVEIFSFFNDGSIDVNGVPGPDVWFNLAIELHSGTAPELMKYVHFGDSAVQEYDTASATIYGHRNSASAVTVGAADYKNTPAFGVTPALLQPYSSAGGTPTLFDTDGTPKHEVRAKPDVVAPDGVNNTFLGGSDTDSPPDGFPNFYGTSAAVAHLGAVAALVVHAALLTPIGVWQLMVAAALDMYLTGFDHDTGYGFVAALQVLQSIVAVVIWNGVCGVPALSLFAIPNIGPQVFRAVALISWANGHFSGVTALAAAHILLDGFKATDGSSWRGCP